MAENKRLGTVLALVKEQPTTCPLQRRHPTRQRAPDNLDAPGMPTKRRLSCRVAAAALAGAPGRAGLTARISSTVQRYVTQNDEARIMRTVKLRRPARLAATDTAMMRTDPRLTHCAGLRAKASRAALRAPASRLWPLTPSPSVPRLVDMPFRTGVSADGRVPLLLCAGGELTGPRSSRGEFATFPAWSDGEHSKKTVTNVAGLKCYQRSRSVPAQTPENFDPVGLSDLPAKTPYLSVSLSRSR